MLFHWISEPDYVYLEYFLFDMKLEYLFKKLYSTGFFSNTMEGDLIFQTVCIPEFFELLNESK